MVGKVIEIPKDGYKAFYEGCSLEDNPFPEWEQRFEEWDRDFLEAAKFYGELKGTRTNGN